MGGGTDVDALFEWMSELAGGGDFVVIRASGADGIQPVRLRPG
jgi:cyanophycinase